MSYTAKDVRESLEAMTKAMDDGEKDVPWMKAMNRFTADLFARIEMLEVDHLKVRKAVIAIAMEIKGAPAQAPSAPAPQVVGGQPPQRGGVRLGADGEPITNPEQLAAEEMMDAATAGMPPAGPQAPADSRAPAPSNGNGGGHPMPPRGGVRVQPPAEDKIYMGADGQPITDPAQIAAERAMEEAAGPRS